MQLQIYIHGNPKGFNYVGPTNEKDFFFQRFYNRSKSVDKELIIESTKSFCYYTYLLSKNVYDTSGRPDAYFGLTIRFDAYYLNASNIYTLLDTLCNKWVVGDLLKVEGANLQYTTTGLNQNVFDNIQNDVVAWIKRADNTDFSDNLDVNVTNTQTKQLNLVDCSVDNVKKYVQQYGIVSVSTEYILLRESIHESRLQTLNQQWTDRWNDLQAKHNTAISNVQGLNGTIQNLQGQLSQAQNDLQRVQKEFNDYKTSNKLNHDILNGLMEEKKALLKLAGFIDSLDIKPKQSRTNGKNRDIKSGNDKSDRHGENDIRPFDIRKCIRYIILVLIAGAIVWFLFSLKDCSDNVVAYNVEQPIPEQTEGVIEEITETQESKVTESEKHTALDIDISKLYIDIKEFTKTKNYMEENDAYTIRICDANSHNPIDGINGFWIIQDSDFYVGNPSFAETTITPKRKGKDLLVKFCIEGNEATPLERIIEVK